MALDAGKAEEAKKAYRAGLASLFAGLFLIAGGALSAAFEAAWVLALTGFFLLLYAIPALHQHQEPADGALGVWGSRLFVFGASIVVVLAVIFLIWEVLGDPGEPAWTNIVWPIAFFSMLAGIVLFMIGSFKAGVLEPLGLWLIVTGLLGGIAVDMATGAFFEENGETTEWGFYVGIPLMGLGLAWIGYRLWSRAK